MTVYIEVQKESDYNVSFTKAVSGDKEFNVNGMRCTFVHDI